MPTFQLTTTGLDVQTQEEIFEDIKASIQAAFGPNTNVSATSFFGIMANMMAEMRAADQQTALDLYESFDPNSADGVSLDQRAALTGSVRRGATNSIIVGTVTISGPVNIPNGSLISLDETGTQWELISGPIVEVVPGDYAATFQAVAEGPLVAFSGSDWTIVSVISNWDSFQNPVEDATLGRYEESDAAFRQRRNVEIFSEGRGSLNVIAAVVSEVATENGQVDQVKVYHNPTVNPFDSNGIPFKAFNVVVRTTPPIDPLDLPPTANLQQDIADAILRALGAGGEAFGTDVVLSSVDIESQNQPIAFDVFRDSDIYLYITIETAAFVAPFNNLPIVPLDPTVMADLVREYVATRAVEDLTAIGQDVLSFELAAFINELVISQSLRGVNFISVQSNLTGVPPYDDITEVGIRFIPNYDTGRIIVNIDGVEY